MMSALWLQVSGMRVEVGGALDARSGTQRVKFLFYSVAEDIELSTIIFATM